MTDSNEGLLPHLQSALGDNFDSWQIRPWNFNQIGQTGTMSDGILILDDETKVYPSHSEVHQDIVIGYMIAVENTNHISTVAGLRDRLDREINCWSRCNSRVEEVNEITGGITRPKQSPTMSSAKLGAWTVVMWRMFTLCFYTS